MKGEYIIPEALEDEVVKIAHKDIVLIDLSFPGIAWERVYPFYMFVIAHGTL